MHQQPAPTFHGDLLSKKTDGWSYDRIMRIMDVTTAQPETVIPGTPVGASAALAPDHRQYTTEVALAAITNSLIRVET